MKNKNMLRMFIFITALFICTGCTEGYTSYDYEMMIDELESEIEYQKDVISGLEIKLEDCQEHYRECFEEAEYCGCLENISRYDYYDFED